MSVVAAAKKDGSGVCVAGVNVANAVGFFVRSCKLMLFDFVVDVGNIQLLSSCSCKKNEPQPESDEPLPEPEDPTF